MHYFQTLLEKICASILMQLLWLFKVTSVHDHLLHIILHFSMQYFQCLNLMFLGLFKREIRKGKGDDPQVNQLFKQVNNNAAKVIKSSINAQFTS